MGAEQSNITGTCNVQERWTHTPRHQFRTAAEIKEETKSLKLQLDEVLAELAKLRAKNRETREQEQEQTRRIWNRYEIKDCRRIEPNEFHRDVVTLSSGKQIPIS
ncbi:MAG: hypothetical protein GY799_28155, partial [Desulfobulbaceae bacterium]|nr:hypothetical protein [Desulfobulbaceae bacterium]